MSYANGPKIVTNDIQCLIDVSNRKSVSSTSNEAIDLTGNGYNAIFRNYLGTQTSLGSMDANLAYDTSDSPKACLNFVGYGNGSQGYMQWNSHPLSGYSSYSIESWFKIINLTPVSNYNVIFYSSSPDINYQPLGFMAQNSTSDPDLALEVNNNYTSGSSGYRIQLGWNHCVLTYAGTIAKVYINNSLKYTKGGLTSNYSIPTGSWNWVGVGQWANSGYNGSYGYTQGKLGSIAFYSRELSANEVQQNYNALKGRYGLT